MRHSNSASNTDRHLQVDLCLEVAERLDIFDDIKVAHIIEQMLVNVIFNATILELRFDSKHPASLESRYIKDKLTRFELQYPDLHSRYCKAKAIELMVSFAYNVWHIAGLNQSELENVFVALTSENPEQCIKYL